MDAKKVMDSLGDALTESGAIRASKSQSLEEISALAMKDLADLTGGDLPSLQAKFNETAKSAKNLAVQVTSGKMALQSTSRRINQLVDELDALDKANQKNTAVEERLIDMLELHADMQAAVKNIKQKQPGQL